MTHDNEMCSLPMVYSDKTIRNIEYCRITRWTETHLLLMASTKKPLHAINRYKVCLCMEILTPSYHRGHPKLIPVGDFVRGKDEPIQRVCV